MDKRQDDILTSRLEEILTSGCTFISWNELYVWYGVQKLAAGTYRDLAMRWDELSSGRIKDDGSPLGSLVFVQSPMRPSPGMHLFGSEMPIPVYEG